MGEIRTVAAMVEAEGGPARLWVTEIGWPTHADERGVDERTQARYLVRTLALLRSIEVVEKVYWYDFKNDGLDTQYNEDNFGLIRHQKHGLAPKRGVVAAAVFSRLTAGAEPRGLAARRGLGRAPRCARRPTGDRLGHRPRPGDQAPTGRCRGLRHDGQPAGRPGGAGTDGRPALRCGAGLVGLVSSKRPAALNTGESTALGNAGCSERLQHAPQTGISACPPGDGSLRDVFDPSSDRGCRDCHGAPENRPVGGAGLGGEFPAVGAGSTDTRIAVSGALPE